MAPLRAAKPTLAGAVAECQDAVNALNEACKTVLVSKEDCLRLGKFTKRFGPLLDDLKDNVVEPNAEQKGVAALKDVTKALQRCTAAISRCGSIGPLQALLQAVPLAQELTDGGIDLQAALAAIDAKCLGVATDLQEDLAQFVRQLTRANVCVFPATAHKLVADLHVEAEKVRSGAGDARELSALITGQVLAECSAQQLQWDAAFIGQQRAEAAAAGAHVEGALYEQLGSIVQAMLRKAGAAGAAKAATAAAQQAATKPGCGTSTSQEDSDSPIANASDLLAWLCRGSACGGAASGAPNGANAANGADASTAKAVMRLQAALPLLLALGMEDGGPFLSRELPVLVGGMPAVEREDVLQVQLLSLLLPLARDSSDAQQQMVAATAIPGLVQLMATVRIIKGVATVVTPAAAAAEGEDAAAAPLDKQPSALRKGTSTSQAPAAGPPRKGSGLNDASSAARAEGSGLKGGRGVQFGGDSSSTGGGKSSGALMLGDEGELTFAEPPEVESLALQLLAVLAGTYKAEVVAAGGLQALAQVLSGSHVDGIKAGAAGTLVALVGDNKVIGLQAVKGDLLMPLARAWSTGGPALRQLAREAMLQLLQPTVELPMPAPVLRGASLSAAAARAATATAAAAAAAATAGATAAQLLGSQDEAEAEAVVEVGRAFSAASVTAAMYLLSKGERELELPLMRVLRYGVGTQATRAAAFSHDGGLQRLLEMACSSGQGSGPKATVSDAGTPAMALDVLKALCEEKDSKPSLGPRLVTLLQGGDTQRAACARVLAELAPPFGASAKDKAAAKASAQLCMSLNQAGGIVHLVELLRSPRPEVKAAGVAAINAMCVWGDGVVRASVMAAQAVHELIDVVKAGPVDGPLCTAATEALAVLAGEGVSASQQIFDSLVAYLKPASPALAYNAAFAARRIAGDAPSHITQLGKAGAPAALVRLLKEGSGHNLTAAASLLLAITRSAAGETNAAAAAAEGAVTVLLGLLKNPEESVRVAAAGVLGILARQSAQQREAVYAARGVPDLVDVLKGAEPQQEGWDDAAQALAVMAVFCDAARPEVVRAMRTLLARGSARESSAAAAVVSGLAASPKGREALLCEGLLAGMVGLLATGTAASKAAVADALTKLAAPAYVQLGAADGNTRSSSSVSTSSSAGQAAGRRAASGNMGGAPIAADATTSSSAAAAAAGRRVDPKVEVVKAGAVAPLVALVRSPPDEQCLVEACEALYCLAGCSAGLTAARQSGLVDVLQSVVLRGKRKEIGDKAAKAAYETLMRVL